MILRPSVLRRPMYVVGPLLAWALAGCPSQPVEPRAEPSDAARQEPVAGPAGALPPGEEPGDDPFALADPPPEVFETGPEGGGRGERCIRVEGAPPSVGDYFCPVDCPLDEPSCQRFEVALALVRAEVDQAQRETVYGAEHPDVVAGRRVIEALAGRQVELAGRDWPLDVDALHLRLEREMALERLAMEGLAAQRLPHHPDLVARRARLERLRQRLDELAAGTWP
ncbi:MAG: hypothetical protein JXB32_11795 [Deltaproteobacteria bacterium]|nr:hypothetical protein [Deltaproteobacteria bacterium]